MRILGYSDERQKAVAIAREQLREAFYRSYHDLDVEGIVDAVEEYVSARLKLVQRATPPQPPQPER